MRPYLIQRLDELLEQRPPDGQELVTFTESLVTEFVEELSEPGDVVLDPFAGFGTTLVVAERLGRRGLGVELMPDRVAHVRGRIGPGSVVIQGDARDVDTLVSRLDIGPVTLCFTSPPYMTRNDHPEDPLQAYEVEEGDYAGYLAALAEVFGRVAQVLAPEGHVVVNVANTTEAGVFTPLAWDVARALSEHLDLLGETYVAWDTLLPGIASDHCLMFRRPE